MDLEDYGQEENDTALHLCAPRQRHKSQDDHRGSHCKCIIIQSVWFVLTIGCNVQLLNFTNHIFPDIETDRSCTDLDMIYTNYRDFGGLEKLS